ncbi:MAG: energy-coupling factor transporter transmembrane protein EcfT [Lachnospiraceae bacterium]|nr:energy-coupling factor transporter transmembrane protein EcfT [Candidatus Equihabitans merdae]
MDRVDTFSTYNPILNFAYFIGAIGLGMIFMHPLFLVVNLVGAFAYALTQDPKKVKKLMPLVVIMFTLITLINPLLNTNGKTVLFTWLHGRPYTLESMCWGMVTGSMFAAIIIWFAAYNHVMTSDKFVYLFGKVVPSISLVLTMILRLIPNFQKKANQIMAARASIGMTEKNMENVSAVFSALTGWALEGGIVTADSMRARGYGSGNRTTFSIYRFDKRDVAMLVAMFVLISGCVVCALMGGAEVTFVPDIQTAPITNMATALGIICYGLFLLIPIVLNTVEALRWHILRSRI